MTGRRLRGQTLGIKPEGTNEYEDFHCINIYDTNEPAHKSASDTNTAEMEENFYQGYQG